VMSGKSGQLRAHNLRYQEEIKRIFTLAQLREAKGRLCRGCIYGLSVGVCEFGLLPLTKSGGDCPYREAQP
jgi:hypothetical protein